MKIKFNYYKKIFKKNQKSVNWKYNNIKKNTNLQKINLKIHNNKKFFYKIN